MKLQRTQLLVAATLAVTSATTSHAIRRAVERAPGAPPAGLAVAGAPAAAEDLALRLEAMRIEREFGDDWDEALVETAEGAIDTVLRKHGGTWRGRALGRDAVRAPERCRPIDWYVEMRRDPEVRRIEPNPKLRHPGCRQMSIDILETGTQLIPELALQPALRIASASSLPADGIVVAVVDSGVAPLADLTTQLEPSVDVLHPHGPVVVDNPEELASDALDAHGHGTAMATLVASVASGAKLKPIRVVGSDCEGTAFDLAAGLHAAADAGARVALVSLSTPYDSPLLRHAVEDVTARGMLVVAAAGNAGAMEYPAAYPGVLAVTAVGADGWPPAFAPQGGAVVLAAPGVDVVAIGPEGTLRMTGTSPAAALAAGAAARVAALLPDAGPEEWLAVLRWSVRPAGDVAPQLEGLLGAGILDFRGLR